MSGRGGSFGASLSGNAGPARVSAKQDPEFSAVISSQRSGVWREASGLAGIVAFYSIVHFEPGELPAIMREMRRVLAAGGLALVSFHVGNEIVHVDELFGAPVDLDFRFHASADVVAILRGAAFAVIEHVEREPYEGAEYPSRRCYLLAKAV